MKALIADDSRKVREAIELCMTMRWPDVEILTSDDPAALPSLVSSHPVDIAFFEPYLPDREVLYALKEVRKFSDVPVIIVSVREDEVARVKGLEAGADDYIMKPFSHTELLARVKAVLRRVRGMAADGYVLAFNGVSMDMARRRVSVHGEDVNLTPTEWNLLSYLIRNEGKVVTHESLAENVWGSEFLGDSAIKTCVRRLRQKLDDDPQAPKLIHCHRGLGYSFKRPLN